MSNSNATLFKKHLFVKGKTYQANTWHSSIKSEVNSRILNKFTQLANVLAYSYNIKKAEEAGISIDIEKWKQDHSSSDNQCSKYFIDTAGTWSERKGFAHKVEIFKSLIRGYVNIPSDEELALFFEKQWGKCGDDIEFRNAFPNFKFAYGEEITDLIISANPVHTESEKYLGTADEVRAAIGKLPKKCIFIANNLTPAQQCWLSGITAMGHDFIATDSTSGTGFMVDVRTSWEIIFL